MITTGAKSLQSQSNEYHILNIIYKIMLCQRTNNLELITNIWSTRGCNKTKKNSKEIFLTLPQLPTLRWKLKLNITTTELQAALEDADPTAPAGAVDLESAYKYVTEFLGIIDTEGARDEYGAIIRYPS